MKEYIETGRQGGKLETLARIWCHWKDQHRGEIRGHMISMDACAKLAAIIRRIRPDISTRVDETHPIVTLYKLSETLPVGPIPTPAATKGE